MIGVRVSRKPFFGLFFPFIILPEFNERFVQCRRRRDKSKSHIGVIHHTPWLANVHFDTIVFGIIAECGVNGAASIHVAVVEFLTGGAEGRVVGG